MIDGFNKTVLQLLPRSSDLIAVESVLMGAAFIAMIIVRPSETQTLTCTSWVYFHTTVIVMWYNLCSFSKEPWEHNYLFLFFKCLKHHVHKGLWLSFVSKTNGNSEANGYGCMHF